MPLGVYMVFRTNKRLDYHSLEKLQQEFMTAFGFDLEDFYIDGPFVYPDIQELTDDLREITEANSEYIGSGFWININLWKSYYGPGYERGDIQQFVVIAEWLEERLPNCHVYYGEDSSHVLRRFDKTYRDRIIKYYELVKNEPYYTDDNRKSEQLRIIWDELE